MYWDQDPLTPNIYHSPLPGVIPEPYYARTVLIAALRNSQASYSKWLGQLEHQDIYAEVCIKKMATRKIHLRRSHGGQIIRLTSPEHLYDSDLSAQELGYQADRDSFEIAEKFKDRFPKHTDWSPVIPDVQVQEWLQLGRLLLSGEDATATLTWAGWI